MSLDVQRISLDISKRPTPQQVRLGQGDANGTQLIADIFDDGVAYILEDYDVRLEMRLPAGDMYYSVDGAKSGNTATFDIDETYAATCFGFDGFGYVDILDGDEVICSTSRFQLVVLRNAQDGADPSTAYSNGIIEATERAIAAAEAAEGVVLQDVPTMSATVKGGALLGSGLTMDGQTLSVDGSSIDLPTMAANVKGAAKLGSGLTVSNDTLSLGSHVHSASDITSGTLDVGRGGTGATTAAGAKAAIVDGQALAPASVAATGAVSGSSISDGTGTLAQLRESVSQDITYSNVSTGSVTYVKRANIVTVTVNISALNSAPSANTSYRVGTLPAGARPGGNVFGTLFQLDTPVGNIYTNESGSVSLRITGTPSASVLYRGNSTFVAVN